MLIIFLYLQIKNINAENIFAVSKMYNLDKNYKFKML